MLSFDMQNSKEVCTSTVGPYKAVSGRCGNQWAKNRTSTQLKAVHPARPTTISPQCHISSRRRQRRWSSLTFAITTIGCPLPVQRRCRTHAFRLLSCVIGSLAQNLSELSEGRRRGGHSAGLAKGSRIPGHLVAQSRRVGAYSPLICGNW